MIGGFGNSGEFWHDTVQGRVRIMRFIRWMSLLVVVLLWTVTGCDEIRREILPGIQDVKRLAAIEDSLAELNSQLDSLTYSLVDSHLLLDGMRAQVDSMQTVNSLMLESVKNLNRRMREESDSLEVFRRGLELRRDSLRRRRDNLRRKIEIERL
jgi:hypothetical protein